MYLSKRVEALAPSITLSITSKLKEMKSKGIDVLSFGAGEPDLPTPDFVCEAGIRAIKDGKTRYTPSAGIPELRNAVAAYYKRYSVDVDPDGVFVSCGAKDALFNIIMSVVNRGDGVIIPAPYWVSYPEMVKVAEGEPIFLKTSAADGFQIDPNALEDVIKKNRSVKLLVLNSPSNPTGAVYRKERLKEIADVVLRHNIYVISDEIYDALDFTGRFTPFVKVAEGLDELVFTVNGVSKTFSMTGWRIGYAFGPKDVIKKAVSLQSHSISNPSSISQYAAVAALEKGDEWRRHINKVYKERAELLCKAFSEEIGLAKVYPPEGTFYAFIDISGYNMSGMKVAESLLEKAKVGVVPGEGFGDPNWVRFSFACAEKDILEGVKRWAQWEKL